MKIDRQLVYNKYNGKCAYTGLNLDDKWQVDHAVSKCQYGNKIQGIHKTRQDYENALKDVDSIENLLPALRRVNHYKRGQTLEQFRFFMLKFHIRLAKLPKNTLVESTKKRIEYMNDIANVFGITTEKPFKGTFYFETL